MSTVITLGHYTALARLHGGDLNARIASVGFGTGSASATEADTGLTDAYAKALDHVEAIGRVLRFHWSLARHEAVGLAIREIGLFTADGVLVSRQVRAGAILKEADMELGDYFDLQL